MSETITTFQATNPEVAIPMDRKKFYEQEVAAFASKKPTGTAAGIVNIFIFDSSGELYVQKRSDHKAHNPGLLDKTIGGHIRFGETNEYTVMVETVQELQVPSITLRTEADFLKTYALLRDYLSTVAIIRHIDTAIHPLQKIIGDQNIPVLNKVHLCFGVYNGAVKTVDREAKGVLLYSLADLEHDMETSPALFTNDLRFLLKHYHAEIEKFIELTQTA